MRGSSLIGLVALLGIPVGVALLAMSSQPAAGASDSGPNNQVIEGQVVTPTDTSTVVPNTPTND